MIWTPSSREGTTISTPGNTSSRGRSVSRADSVGRRYARVLPLPVNACKITSCPAVMAGTARSCVGVGRRYPSCSARSASQGTTPRPSHDVGVGVLEEVLVEVVSEVEGVLSEEVWWARAEVRASRRAAAWT